MSNEEIKGPENLSTFNKNELEIKAASYYGFKLGLYKMGNSQTSDDLFVINIRDPKVKTEVDSGPIFDLMKENLPDGDITFEQLEEAAKTAITVLPNPEKIEISLTADADTLRVALECFRADDWDPAVRAGKVKEIASRTMGYESGPLSFLLKELQ